MLLSYIVDNTPRLKRRNLNANNIRSSISLPFFSNKGKKYISTPLEALSHRIKETVTNSYEAVEFAPKSQLSTDLEVVEVKVGSYKYKVRKVYLCTNSYQIGWVVDSDLQQCMSCELNFSWMRFRHHCR